MFPDFQQFRALFRINSWRLQLQIFEGVEHDARNDQARILLIVGWHDVPMGVIGAGAGQAVLVGLLVVLPVLPLFNVSRGELPVLARVIDAFEESLPLLLFREVEKDFDDPGPVAMQVAAPNPRWS